MIFNFLKKLGKNLAIDLGTSNILIYEAGKGIILNEPSVVAINQDNGRVVEVGMRAKLMVGKTPGNIVAVRPLVNGIVADFETTEQMLKFFIDKIRGSNAGIRPPRVVMGVPSSATDVQKRAVKGAAMNAGVDEAFLIEEPMAAAIGAGLPVNESVGNLIVEIGGGTCEMAMISLGGIVVSRSINVAGDKLNQDIIDYLRKEENLIVGDQTAEKVKIAVGSAIKLEDELSIQVPGRDLITGLPKEIRFTSNQALSAFEKSLSQIVRLIKEAIELSPPELVIDVYKNGIILSGGTSQIRGLDKLIEKETGIKTILSQDPMTNVVRGASQVLDELQTLSNVLVRQDNKRLSF